MKSFYLIALNTVLSFYLNSQNVSFKWVKGVAQGNSIVSRSIASDGFGNVYTVGSFDGTVDFDPGAGVHNVSALAGTTSGFILKLDAWGNFVWVKTISSKGFAMPYDICLDGGGNPCIAGLAKDTTDFDPGVGTYTLDVFFNSAFILKLDIAGNFVWAKSIAGGGLNEPFITCDPAGNIFTTGDYSSTRDFDPGPAVYNLSVVGNTYAMFVSRLDAAGNFVWVKNITGTGSAQNKASAISLDSFGNVHIGGCFFGTVDFDPSPNTYNITSSSTYNAFVLKLTPSGSMVWAKSFGGTNGGAIILDMGVDPLGNIYAAGGFNNTADLDPGAGTYTILSLGNLDIFISKLDAAGNFVWARNQSGTNDEYAIGLALDNQNNVYTTGYFGGVVDFDHGATNYFLSSVGFMDTYVSKTDAAGNFVWAKRMGGAQGDYGYAICTNTLGNIYTTGTFQGTADFNPGPNSTTLTAPSGESVFVHKIAQCSALTSTLSSQNINCFGGNNGSATVSASGAGSYSYTWSSGTVNSPTITGFNAGVYTCTVTNDCEFSATHTFTITQPGAINILTSISGQTLAANATGATYQWIDCNNNNMLIPGANGQNYVAPGDGSFAVIVSTGGCSDTSACTSIITVGLKLINDLETMYIYPNPNNGIFIIEIDSPAQVIVTNMFGQEIINKMITDKRSNKISIEDRANGIYFLKIIRNNRQQEIKIIKE